MVNLEKPQRKKVTDRMEAEGKVKTLSAEATRSLDLKITKAVEAARKEIDRELKAKGIKIEISNQ